MAKAVMPRRVHSAEERNAGRGQFISLKKTGEQFLGYALFVADPERDDNPGYYEYFEHYTPATGYVPCSGDGCPLCDEGDSPNTRAKSSWLIVDKDDTDPDNGQVKVFNLNWSLVQEFVEDGADALGQLYRVKALEGKGKFSIRPKTDKLTKTQLKAAMKNLPDLEQIAVKQLRRALEEMDVADAMTEDDDDETATKNGKTKARPGKAKAAPEPAADFDPDNDEEFEGTVTVKKIVKSKNKATVITEDETEFEVFGTDDIDLADLEKEQEIELVAAKEDDDWVVTTIDGEGGEAEAGAGDGDVPAKLEDEKVVVVSVNSEDETLTLALEDGTEFDLYFLSDGEDPDGNDWSDFDLDDFEVEQSVIVNATRDSDGDMVADSFPQIVKKTRAAGGKKKKK